MFKPTVEEVFEKIREIISDQSGFPKDDIEMEMSLHKNFNLDSLDLVELLMSIEEEFSLEIKDEDAEKAKTIADVVKYVRDCK